MAGITQVTNTVGDMIWQVSGAESVLSLPNLEKITNSGTGSNWDIYLRALDGGQLDLSSVTEMVDPNSGNQTARSIQVKADGQDSVVKLNALQSVSDYTAYETGDYNGEYSRLEPVNGGTIELGSLTTVTGVYIPLDGTGVLDMSTIVDLRSSYVNMSNEGVTPQLDSLSNIDNSRILLTNGATLTIPVTSYSATGIPGNYTLFSADGEGSRLELPYLESLNDGWNDNSSTARAHVVKASNGGFVDLSRLTNITLPVRIEDTLEVRQETGGVVLTPDFDLAVESVSDPVAAMLGGSFTFNWSVRNQGQGLAGGKWTDNVYLSADEVLDGNDVLLGSYTFDTHSSGRLEPNDTYQGSLTTSVPAVVPDDYYVIVRVNHHGILPENNIENNTLAAGSDPSSFRVVLLNPNRYFATAITEAEIVFSRPLSADVDYRDYITITGGHGEVDIESAEVINSTSLRLTFAPLDTPGEYRVVVDSSTPDAVGELLDQDRDGFPGESSDDMLRHTWRLDTDAFTIFTHYPRSGGVDQLTYVDVAFTREVNESSLDLNDITIKNPSGAAISPTSIERMSDNGQEVYRVRFNPLSQSGQYTLHVGQDASDIDGVALATEYTGAILVQAGDLVVQEGVNFDGSSVAGEPLAITYSVQNVGVEAISGDLADAAYLSKDNAWGPTDTQIGTLAGSIDLAPGASVQRTLAGNLPGVTPGSYFVFVVTDLTNEFPELDSGNNRRMLGQITVEIPALETSVAVSESFSASDTTDYYTITVPRGENATLKLDGTSGAHGLYIAEGRVPSRQDYDIHATGTDPRVTIPSALLPTTYYVMAYNVEGTAENYQILADSQGMSVTDSTPTVGSNTSATVLRITGTGFVPGMSVKLTDGDDNFTVEADSINIISSEVLEATFAKGTLTSGTYDLLVRHLDMVFAGPAAITIVDGGKGVLETNLIMPEAIGYHWVSTLYVEYSNTGTAAMPAPLLFVTAEQKWGSWGLLDT